ncbi:MAG: hypothetical protein JWN41_1817 [Thermoleophilia bacterium]|nr:hypothetical protein [Thermoleophilia bacterium]
MPPMRLLPLRALLPPPGIPSYNALSVLDSSMPPFLNFTKRWYTLFSADLSGDEFEMAAANGVS